MKHLYLTETAEELLSYQRFMAANHAKLEQYLSFLRENYCVTDLPRAVLWTSCEAATKLISDIPIPAYTNDYRTVFCPDIDTWRVIYLKQLDTLAESKAAESVSHYYETALTENHVLQILGHEFVHHSDLFIDEAYDKGIWFEEGMCEYISRKYFLTDAQFMDEAGIHALLVEQYQQEYGAHSLDDFGSETYRGDYASIFYEYWRSFLAVKKIIDRFDGNVMQVFREYHRWHKEADGKNLAEWFHVSV